MLKLFKIAVTGLDTSDSILGHNVDYKTTMGYNEETKEIHVLVENIILPELGTESVDLRGEHTTATFTTAAERTFTAADFPKTSENMKWMVEFDAETKTIKDPIDVYPLTVNKITGSQTGRLVPRFLKERWSDTTVPLFSLDSFYKSSEGFDTSVLTFFEFTTGNELVDDVITNTDIELVNQKEKEFWLAANVNTNVAFEVLDSDGKIVSTLLPNVKTEALAGTTVPMLTLNADKDHPLFNDESSLIGGQFKVSLPAADTFKIRAIFSRNLANKNIPVTFDVDCVNGVSNKSRVICTGFDLTNRNIIDYKAQHDVHATPSRNTLCGVDVVVVNSFGLVSGDYIKLKLDLGEFKSYAELWIDLV